MFRLPGMSAEIRALFRPWATEPAAVVTIFGGATGLLFVLSLWYWVGDRRKIATVVSYAFVALGLVLLLKTLFGLPRPPESVQAVAHSADPYGFPSGHATAAVVVYGGLVAVYDRFESHILAFVTAVIGAIALSRVVIGVHYFGDILAGLVLGAVLLATLWRLIGPDPFRAFAVATFVTGIAMLVGAPESALGFGGSLGGLLGSSGLDRIPSPRSYVERAALVVLGIPLVFGIDEVIDAANLLPVTILGNTLLVVAILLLPLLVGKVPLDTH